MREIRVVLVGCGYVANEHLRAWKKVPQARLAAVIDLNENIARRTAEVWNIPAYYATLSGIIGRSKIDLIDICTPPQVHASLAVQAMEAGSNVLIEKPMTMTVKDAEKIVECQKATGMKVGVIHNWLFEPPVIEATSLMKKGLLGEIISVDIEALNTKDDSMAANEHHWCHSLPGGRFSEMLAHPIYLVRHFLGEPDVRDVNVDKIGEYAWMRADELCATFGVRRKLARAYASFNAPRNAIFISLYGTEAILKLDVINATMTKMPKRVTSRFSKGFDSLREATQLMKSTAKNVARITSRRWLSGHEAYIRLFAETMFSDLEPPVTAEDGSRVVRVLEQMLERIEIAEESIKTSAKVR